MSSRSHQYRYPERPTVSSTAPYSTYEPRRQTTASSASGASGVELISQDQYDAKGRLISTSRPPQEPYTDRRRSIYADPDISIKPKPPQPSYITTTSNLRAPVVHNASSSSTSRSMSPLDKPTRPTDNYYVTSSVAPPTQKHHKRQYSVDSASRLSDATSRVSRTSGYDSDRERARPADIDRVRLGHRNSVTRSDRPYHLAGPAPRTPLPPVSDISENNGYEYTDARGMYRDTEPLRRRRGSVDTGSRERPYGIYDPQSQLSRTREMTGPPPTTRGFDRIDNGLNRIASLREGNMRSPPGNRSSFHGSFGEDDDRYRRPITAPLARNEPVDERRESALPSRGHYDDKYDERYDASSSAVAIDDPHLSSRGWGIRSPTLAQAEDSSLERRGPDSATRPYFDRDDPRDRDYGQRDIERDADRDYENSPQTIRDHRRRRERRLSDSRIRDEDILLPPDRDTSKPSESEWRRDRAYDQDRDSDRDRRERPPHRPRRVRDSDDDSLDQDSDRDRRLRERDSRRPNDKDHSPSFGTLAAVTAAGGALAFGAKGALDRRDRDRDRAREQTSKDEPSRGDRLRDEVRDQVRDRPRDSGTKDEMSRGERLREELKERPRDQDGRGELSRGERLREELRNGPRDQDVKEELSRGERLRTELREEANRAKDDRNKTDVAMAEKPREERNRPAIEDRRDDRSRENSPRNDSLAVAAPIERTASAPPKPRADSFESAPESSRRVRHYVNSTAPAIEEEEETMSRRPQRYDAEEDFRRRMQAELDRTQSAPPATNEEPRRQYESMNGRYVPPEMPRKIESSPSDDERKRDDSQALALYRKDDDEDTMFGNGMTEEPGELAGARDKRVTIVEPAKETVMPKGILKKPKDRFPEHPQDSREGVSRFKDAPENEEVPANARWTKIDRRLVNPAALHDAGERFEERADYVVVLRPLTKSEIQKLADRTSEIRGQPRPVVDDEDRDSSHHHRRRHRHRDEDDEDDRKSGSTGGAGGLLEAVMPAVLDALTNRGGGGDDDRKDKDRYRDDDRHRRHRRERDYDDDYEDRERDRDRHRR